MLPSAAPGRNAGVAAARIRRDLRRLHQRNGAVVSWTDGAPPRTLDPILAKEGPAMLIFGLPVIVYGALLAVIALLVVRRRGLMRGETRHVTRAVWCPIKDRTLSAQLEEEIWDGRRVDIDACSAFSPTTAVTCEKACLRLTERPRRARASGFPLLF
jgi:hypothetical protein